MKARWSLPSEQSIHVLLHFAIVQFHPYVRHRALIRPQDAMKERIYRIRTIANMQLDGLVLVSAARISQCFVCSCQDRASFIPEADARLP